MFPSPSIIHQTRTEFIDFACWAAREPQIGHWLNTGGLLLGIVGVLVIFIWGPPQPDFDEYVGIAIQPATVLRDGTRVSDIVDSAKRRKRKYQVVSRAGLGMVLVGFVVQLLAVWV